MDQIDTEIETTYSDSRVYVENNDCVMSYICVYK